MAGHAGLAAEAGCRFRGQVSPVTQIGVASGPIQLLQCGYQLILVGLRAISQLFLIDSQFTRSGAIAPGGIGHEISTPWTDSSPTCSRGANLMSLKYHGQGRACIASIEASGRQATQRTVPKDEAVRRGEQPGRGRQVGPVRWMRSRGAGQALPEPQDPAARVARIR